MPHHHQREEVNDSVNLIVIFFVFVFIAGRRRRRQHHMGTQLIQTLAIYLPIFLLFTLSGITGKCLKSFFFISQKLSFHFKTNTIYLIQKEIRVYLIREKGRKCTHGCRVFVLYPDCC